MPRLDEQISTLEEKLKQLKLRQQRIDARRKAIDTQRQRKAETRRKILVGGLVLEKVRGKIMDEGLLRGWLDEALSRTEDRALFGLGPRAEPTADQSSG